MHCFLPLAHLDALSAVLNTNDVFVACPGVSTTADADGFYTYTRPEVGHPSGSAFLSISMPMCSQFELPASSNRSMLHQLS
jgi:hypothetical protein